MPLIDPGAYTQASWLFARGLGLVAAVAFVSLLVQLPGLFGSRGILPIVEVQRALRAQGAAMLARAPTLFWVRADDWFLWTVGALGLAASLLVVVDVATVPALLVTWLCYLSFVIAGREFLSFQWDVLLLEALLVGVLLAALAPPSAVALLLVWVLLFRFMVASGAAKLRSGDPTWRGLTALYHHFETQPLPTALAWYAHKLPRPLLRAATLASLVIELGVPFLLLGPEPLQLAAVGLLALLQVAILATGNYGVFNLLALVLLIPLIPDRWWGPVIGDLGAATAAAGPAQRGLIAVLAGGFLALQLLRLATLVIAPRWLQRLLGARAAWRLANPYGLFAVMTTTHLQLRIEASEDGRTWRPYRFRWRPQDPGRRPRWNAPHQPRLDWQVWFAALGRPWASTWFLQFAQRLLEGSPPVRRLLAGAPADPSPRMIRAVLEAYRFTGWAEGRRSGRWWAVEELGLACPPLTLEGGRVRLLRPPPGPPQAW